MKRIILVRHATAVARNPKKGDYRRSLRKKGRREAKAMAEWYKSTAEAPGQMISSPANRAIETARIFAKVLGYPAKKIVQKKRLYGGLEAADFLELVKTLDDKQTSVMLFGHDPDFSETAQYLTKGFQDTLPKCSVLGVAVNSTSWSTIQPGRGKIEFYEHPQGLVDRAELVNKTRSEVSAQIESSIVAVLTEFDVELRDKDARAIRRTSAKLVRAFVVEPRTESRVPAAKKATRKRTRGEKAT